MAEGDDVSGNERPTEKLTAVTDCRDLVRSAAAAQRLPSRDLETSIVSGDERGRRVAAFAGGSVLVVGAVTALHNLYRRGDDAAELIAWSCLLLLALTALGGGIKLAMWGVRPATAAVFDAAKARLTEFGRTVVAAGSVIAGASGMWWTFRGGYASWWQQVSGEHRWTLLFGVGQMLVAVAAGAALFTGGQYVTGLAKEALGEAGLLAERGRAGHRGDTSPSHPALLAALIAGGGGLVVMAAWLTPKLAPTIAGSNVLPAVVAIAAVLVWAVGSNLGWWHGLAGLYTWATNASQKVAATAAVIAVLAFSAGGLGLGWFTPATVPQAHAACPPDCGGGGGLDGPPGGGSQFRPPDMPASQPDYSSGNYGRPPLDQNSGISIYNENPASGQVPSQTGGQQSMQEPAFQANPDGSWQARNGEWSPPNYQTATPFTQGPGRPNPDWPGNQGAQPNTPQQPAQQAPQQQVPQQQPQQAPQQPQENPAQQPDQQPQQSDSQRIDDLTRQLQEQQQQGTQDRQRIDDLTKQLQQQQNKQNQKQQLPRFPSKDDKKDRDQQDRDDQSGDNDLSALLLGAASTRRRKQDEQGSSGQQQPQGPDTQALAQDGAQLGQSLPGDIANTVSDSVNLGQSAGSAAQNFGSAAQAGASLASSAQSGAVNPMDAVALVQGVSGGISDTADAVGSGASIASTWINNAGQGAQLAADANPQLEPQAEQVQQLTKAGGQVADLTGQVAGGVSQVSGVVNSVSSMGSGGIPDGTAQAMSGPTDGGGDKLPYELQNGPVPGGDADEVGSLNSIQDLLDQAIVDKQAQAAPLQKALDDAVSQAYMDGAGSGFKSAMDRAGQLRGQLAQLYGDIGALSQSADAVSTLQGGVLDGTGTVLDPNNLFQYTFQNGVLTSANYRDPGQAQAVAEPLLSAVTAITGLPGAVRGISALLAREGVAEVATVTAENVLTRAGTQATTQASAAAARLAANRAAGNAFRDAFANELGGAANGVVKEVHFPTSLGGRFIDVMRNGAGFETKTGRISLDSEITKQITKDAELLGTGQLNSVTWVFKLVDPAKVASPANGGPTAPLLKKLTETGFSVLYR